jgi:hypothetical protein
MKRKIEIEPKVLLPCSAYNTYMPRKVESSSSDTSEERLPRWSVISIALEKGLKVKEIHELVDCLESMNPVERNVKYDYSGLIHFFELHLSPEEREDTISLIPTMSKVALQMPILFPDGLQALCS